MIIIVFILIGIWKTISYNVWGYKRGATAVKYYQRMIKLWYSDYHTKLIINKCKKYERLWKLKWWVENCILAIASIWISESWWFRHCYRNQCLWVKSKWFKNVSESLDDWIIRYNKYWYKWKQKWWARFFYSLNWRASQSRYCTEEASSWFKRFDCWNGYKHFNYTFNYLIK